MEVPANNGFVPVPIVTELLTVKNEQGEKVFNNKYKREQVIA